MILILLLIKLFYWIMIYADGSNVVLFDGLDPSLDLFAWVDASLL